MHGASRAAQVALEYYESERTACLEETNQDDDLYAPGIPNGVPLTYLRKDVREICVLSCDFFEAYIKDAKQTEIAPVPKYIKRRLYEHIEGLLAGGAADDERVLEAIANHVITESYHHGNRTTKHNAIRNGLRYARVPGGKSCAFCLMLASRGFVYHSRASAGGGGEHYHAHCCCRIVAGKKDTDIEGYNLEKLNRRMQQVAKELGVTNFNWEDYISDKAMQDLMQREIRLRDENWLLTGIPPEVDYENELAKKNARDHEKEQAKRLAQHGIKCTFQVDYEVDEKTGLRRGKPDLTNGIELKSLTNATNLRGRIYKGLKNASKKKGMKCCHFDAFGTDFEYDEIIQACKREMKLRQVKHVSFIDKDGNYYKL